MGETDTIKQVVEELGRVVDAVGPDQLSNPTGCTEWSVRDIMNHIAGGSIMFAECVEQGSIPDARLGELMGSDNLGSDPKAAFHAATARAVQAFDAPGALEKQVTLPFGTMPAGVALQIAIFDLTTHACDIAKATGQDVKDTAMIENALVVGQQMIGPDMRGTGIFDAEVPCSADASPMDKLLAFAGRPI